MADLAAELEPACAPLPLVLMSKTLKPGGDSPGSLA